MEASNSAEQIGFIEKPVLAEQNSCKSIKKVLEIIKSIKGVGNTIKRIRSRMPSG